MCLENASKAKIAKKDIVCYKFLRKGDLGYFTPFFKRTVEIGKEYKSDIHYNGFSVDMGLHSYRRKSGTDTLNTIYKDGVVVKCVIPKGAIYHKGRFSGERCYASNTLKYVEIVK